MKYFIETVEAKGISNAAERLHVASTAISMQIAQLEEQLGGKLFDRSFRPMRLTSLGDYYYPRAKKILQELAELEGEAAGIASGKKGWLGIGFVRSSLFDLLPRAIRSFHNRLPDVKLSMIELLSDYQPAHLRSEMIHMGISRFLGPYEQAGDLRYDLLFEEPFVAVLPGTHPLADKPSVSVMDLDEMPFISYPKDPYSNFSSNLLNILRDAGANPVVDYEAIEIHTALALVSAGLGATIVGQMVSAQNTNDAAFVPIRDLESKTKIVLITRDGCENSFVQPFIESVKESAAVWTGR